MLAAAVRSFAHMRLMLSNRNKMVLWPGCEGHAVWNLHKKNVRSVRFIVKRKGCCCNLSVGIARRTTPIYMWCEQAITEWSCRVNSIVAFCHSAKLCTHTARAFQLQHTHKKIQNFLFFSKSKLESFPHL